MYVTHHPMVVELSLYSISQKNIYCFATALSMAKAFLCSLLFSFQVNYREASDGRLLLIGQSQEGTSNQMFETIVVSFQGTPIRPNSKHLCLLKVRNFLGEINFVKSLLTYSRRWRKVVNVCVFPWKVSIFVVFFRPLRLNIDEPCWEIHPPDRATRSLHIVVSAIMYKRYVY
jgi:hypothetical protein